MRIMKTIKEIEQQLKITTEQTEWMKKLREDSRIGVQKALAKWQRNYDKQQQIIVNHKIKVAFDSSFAPYPNALIAGVDEAGRGPLAGPVVTAAVILPQDTSELIGLDDSKSISKVNRERLARKIQEVAIDYAIHIQSASTIDELNIYVATRDSMERAVNKLTKIPDFVIVDAMVLNINCPTESVVKADARSLVVAAASILAKTTRDLIMEQLDEKFPAYHFAQNAGYGTPEHLVALRNIGPCEHHRKSFEPVKSMIAKGGLKA